ncbi:unnamed protein product [Ixodes hexagonus]
MSVANVVAVNQRYNLNRSNNQVLRSDLPIAKTVQRTEEEEAQFLRDAYDHMLHQQEVEDAKIALELQQQLQREAAIHASLQQEDERVALELQRRELPKKLERIERRRKDEALPAALRRLSLGEEDVGADAETVERDSDFSDFCLQPPPGLEGEELRRFQEEQDAELARLLQEQETKRRGQSAKDRQMAMEAQDRELAKMLQDQEKARLRRARERARQKAMLQQQQQQDMDTIEELNPANRHTVAPNSTAGTADVLREEEGEGRGEEEAASYLVSPGVKNIAVELDPTFGRKKHSLERQGSSGSGHSASRGSPNNGTLSSTMSSNLGGTIPSAMGGSTSSPALSNVCYDDLDDGEGAVPPYMPIQGQRRSTSFEKGKKGKKTKDACKTQ